jgi:hypothetical protein
MSQILICYMQLCSTWGQLKYWVSAACNISWKWILSCSSYLLFVLTRKSCWRVFLTLESPELDGCMIFFHMLGSAQEKESPVTTLISPMWNRSCKKMHKCNKPDGICIQIPPFLLVCPVFHPFSLIQIPPISIERCQKGLKVAQNHQKLFILGLIVFLNSFWHLIESPGTNSPRFDGWVLIKFCAYLGSTINSKLFADVCLAATY